MKQALVEGVIGGAVAFAVFAMAIVGANMWLGSRPSHHNMNHASFTNNRADTSIITNKTAPDTHPYPRHIVLRTSFDGTFAFVGGNGPIKNDKNPELTIKKGKKVTVWLNNKTGVAHNFVIAPLNVKTPVIRTKQTVAKITFTPQKTGKFTYHCSVANHKQTGMAGTITVY